MIINFANPIFYRHDFFVQVIFLIEYWKWFSQSRRIWGYKKSCQIPWEFDFENFAQILKLRGLRPYTRVFYSKSPNVYILLRWSFWYAGHFDMRFLGRFFIQNFFSAVSSTLEISIKMFQIQKGIFWKYPQNFRRLPTTVLPTQKSKSRFSSHVF